MLHGVVWRLGSVLCKGAAIDCTKQTFLLLLILAAQVPLHIDWHLPQSDAPDSYCAEPPHPPSLVSAVSSPSPSRWWLLSGHLQVEISPIK